jgi:hypothetical protein
MNKKLFPSKFHLMPKIKEATKSEGKNTKKILELLIRCEPVCDVLRLLKSACSTTNQKTNRNIWALSIYHCVVSFLLVFIHDQGKVFRFFCASWHVEEVFWLGKAVSSKWSNFRFHTFWPNTKISRKCTLQKNFSEELMFLLSYSALSLSISTLIRFFHSNFMTWTDLLYFLFSAFAAQNHPRCKIIEEHFLKRSE